MYLGFLIMSVYERWIEYVYIGVEGEGGDDNIVTDGAQPPVPSIYYLQYPLSTIYWCCDHSLHAAHQCNEIMRPAPRSRRQESGRAGRGGAGRQLTGPTLHTPPHPDPGPAPVSQRSPEQPQHSTGCSVNTGLWSLLERKHRNSRNPVRKNIYRGMLLLYKVCDFYCYDSG